MDGTGTQSAVRGIRFSRDAVDERFMRFFSIVQDSARALGKVFFLWCDEGNELITDELDGGDLSGWLVDADDADRFDAIWRRSAQGIPDEFEFVIARWSQVPDGAIGIKFE